MYKLFKKIFYSIEPYLSDKMALKLFSFVLGYPKLNLKRPVTFQDKINYLKLHFRESKITEFSDKLKSKKIIVDNYPFIKTAKVIQIFDDIEELNLSKLPNKFIIKSNYSSGDLKIIKDKKNINLALLKKHFNHQNLLSPYESYTREWGYKNIERKFFIEEYLKTKKGLTDYKFFCFNGNVPFLHVVEDRFYSLKDYIINTNWENLGFNFSDRSYNPNCTPKKPINFDNMLEVSKKVSVGFPFIRVDFFEYNDDLYFSEFTFYPWGGFFKYSPKEKSSELDKFVSEFLDLEDIKCF